MKPRVMIYQGATAHHKDASERQILAFAFQAEQCLGTVHLYGTVEDSPGDSKIGSKYTLTLEEVAQ